MLQIDKTRSTYENVTSTPDGVALKELYTELISFLRRQRSTIVFAFLTAIALAACYLLTAAPWYTGHAVLVLDSHKPQLFQSTSALADVPVDSAAVDTQIEVLFSENIALSVIKDLHLDNDPEFISPPRGLKGTVLGIVNDLINVALPSREPSNASAPSAEFQYTQWALNTFQSRLKARRIGLTYAIQIDFQSLNPDRAAQIANAVGHAYVMDALEAKYQAMRRAASWLQDRLKELREESGNAERAVIDYKAKNNIVDTGGRLINEQQLAEINSALVQARAMTAEAKARLDRVEQILAAGDVDPSTSATATVTDSLHNEVINRLRQQYLDLDAKASDWTRKYGATHLAVINVHNQMRELRRTMFEELQRIAEAYKSDYEIAKTREGSVQKSLNQIISESQTTNEAQITLHSLESSAQTSRALYDSFLQRYMESVQQQSFPVSDSRVITQARRPLGKSSPNALLVLGLAGVGGLILGCGIGVLRDISDRVFRTTAQVGERLHADCISVVPLMKEAVNSGAVARPARPADRVRARAIIRDRSVLWTVIDSPLSRFAEAIRAIKVAADAGSVVKENKVIGITSSLPNEGKSTVATSLAEVIARGGARVVLVDCDLRNPTLSRKLARDAKSGLLEVISSRISLDDVLWTEPSTGFSFLPTVVMSRITHSSEILASEATRHLFKRLRETYDYVIVDLSPLAPVVDVRVMTSLIDSFVFVVEWGRVKIDVAEHALNNARGVYENLLGVVLNKADMNAFVRYEGRRGNYYYNRYYARYGYTD
jgi:succinoglycan biosynthesis transport protein ExoP